MDSASKMEYGDYTRMLKKVCFTSVDERFHYVEFLSSLGWGLMVLEETILQSSRFLFQIGSIKSFTRIPQLIGTIKIAVGSSMMHVASYSARLSWIGAIRRKQRRTWYPVQKNANSSPG